MQQLNHISNIFLKEVKERMLKAPGLILSVLYISISQPPGLVPLAGPENLVMGPKMFDFLRVLKQDQ